MQRDPTDYLAAFSLIISFVCEGAPPLASARGPSLGRKRSLRPHPDPLALATPGLADGQGFMAGMNPEIKEGRKERHPSRADRHDLFLKTAAERPRGNCRPRSETAFHPPPARA